MTYVKTHPVNVSCVGFPGYTTKNLLSVKDSALKTRPDLIIIMTGTNDVAQSNYENYNSDLVTLIDSLRQGNNTDIMLLAPPVYTLQGYNNFNLALVSLQTVIKDICKEKKCFYADANNAFKAAEGLSDALFFPDNVHPTPAGYTIIAKAVLAAYAENDLSKYNIVCFGDSITYGLMVEGAGTATGQTYPAQFNQLLNN